MEKLTPGETRELLRSPNDPSNLPGYGWVMRYCRYNMDTREDAGIEAGHWVERVLEEYPQADRGTVEEMAAEAIDAMFDARDTTPLTREETRDTVREPEDPPHLPGYEWFKRFCSWDTPSTRDEAEQAAAQWVERVLEEYPQADRGTVEEMASAAIDAMFDEA